MADKREKDKKVTSPAPRPQTNEEVKSRILEAVDRELSNVRLTRFNLAGVYERPDGSGGTYTRPD